MRKQTIQILIVIAVVVMGAGLSARAEIQIQPSTIDKQLVDFRAENFVQSASGRFLQADGEFGSAKGKTPGRKSPAKAFLLSLALPGAGQFYNGGSILKPLGFLAIDAAAWGLYFKYHGEGNDLTDEFNAFNLKYWSEHRYSVYLDSAYGAPDDDSITAQEISHHLPSTHTQQYFEMTGKYDQFSWGWDDAHLGETSWADSLTAFNPPKLNEPGNIPTSAHRLTYETMRHNANKKFDNATRMIYVAMANRLISAFEAFLTARRINKSVAPGEFGQVEVHARLRSVYSFADTPSLKVSVRF